MGLHRCTLGLPMQYLTSNKIVCTTVLATLLPALSTEARAGAGPSSASVHYSDLDIVRPDGAKVLLHRIKRAADQPCGGEPESRFLRQHA